jgi:hypothetical protein
MGLLTNRVALVTGSSRGIGAAPPPKKKRGIGQSLYP